MKVIVLAAGCSKRMGQAKQLLKWQGKTMLQHCLDKLTPCDVEIILVLGAYASEIKRTLKQHYKIIENPQWQSGMGSSIVLAMEELNEKDQAVMVILADQPAVSASNIQTLLNHWKNKPEHICCSYSESFLTVPAIFPKQYFSELSNLSANNGAKAILKREAEILTQVSMPNTEININTIDDWNHWLRQLATQQDIPEDTNHEIYAE